MLNAIPTTDYEAAMATFLGAIVSAPKASHNASALTYVEGETIIPVMGLGNRAYTVARGELAVYVNGQPVDLIEAGEYFDESIWLGGEVVALTECVLQPVNQPRPLHH